ncbi:MAG: hypothetical protein NC218_09625 [Acetobacter sp.]|nr:hypothetical protein [Acetobacter sp.]
MHHQEIDGIKETLVERLIKIEANKTSITNAEDRIAVSEQDISDLKTRVSTNEENIALNVNDIKSIVDTLAARESFIGSFLHTATLEAQEGFKGAYANNYETNTKWVWNVDAEEWQDSGVTIED